MTALTTRIRNLADWNPYDPKKLQPRGDGIEPVILEEHQVQRSGVRIVTISFLIFVVWACVAPMDSGVVIPGNVTISGNRKAVQHPGGGVVEDLMVREGSHVNQGDVVLKVNPLDSEANLTNAEAQYITLLTAESRLQAERYNQPIKWKKELEQFGPNNPLVTEAKQLQLQLYGSRRADQEAATRILNEQLAGQRAQAVSLVQVAAEKESQLTLVAKEAKNTVELAKEGYVSEAKANETLRAQSTLQSDRATLIADASKTKANMAATQLQILQTRGTFNKDIDNELSELQKNRDAYLSKLTSLKFARNLTEVRAPVSGTVVGLKVNTVGGVINASQVLMEIVPDGGTLMVEAQVPLSAIDKVRQGLKADMRFSAFNQRTTPVIPGVVKLVGVDRLVSSGTTSSVGNNTEYYLAHVETTQEGLKLLGENKIQPGMPVEVIVKTGERTFMSYLVKPLTDRFARSFKED